MSLFDTKAKLHQRVGELRSQIWDKDNTIESLCKRVKELEGSRSRYAVENRALRARATELEDEKPSWGISSLEGKNCALQARVKELESTTWVHETIRLRARVKELEEGSCFLALNEARDRIKLLEDACRVEPGIIIHCESLLDAQKWAFMVSENRRLTARMKELEQDAVSYRSNLKEAYRHSKDLANRVKELEGENIRSRGKELEVQRDLETYRDLARERARRVKEWENTQPGETILRLREQVKELEAEPYPYHVERKQLRERVKELEAELSEWEMPWDKGE